MTTTTAAGQTTHLDGAIVGEGEAVMQLEGLWLRRVSWGVWVVGFGDWTSAASKAAWVIAVRGCGPRAGLGVLWGSAETVVAEVRNEGLGEDETGSGGGAKDGLGGGMGSPSLGLGVVKGVGGLG